MADGQYGAAMPEDRNQNRFLVRMPPGMREQIAVIAAQNNRSMNAEIVARLEASLEVEAEGMALGVVISRLEDMLRRIEQMGQRS